MKVSILHYLGLMSTILSIYLFYYYDNISYVYAVIFLTWLVEVTHYLTSQDSKMDVRDINVFFYLRRRINPFYLISLMLIILSINIILIPEKLFFYNAYDIPENIRLSFASFMLICAWHLKFTNNIRYSVMFSSFYVLYVMAWIYYLINFDATLDFTDLFQLAIVPYFLFLLDYYCFGLMEEDFEKEIKDIKEKMCELRGH